MDGPDAAAIAKLALLAAAYKYEGEAMSRTYTRMHLLCRENCIKYVAGIFLLVSNWPALYCTSCI